MTKVISLTEIAYEELKSLKHADDSFSDVVIKLIDKVKKHSLLDFFGKWPGTAEETERIKKVLGKERKYFRTREVKF